MNKEEREAAIAYIKGYKKLDEDLHNTAPKDSVSYYATDKCLKYWDMAIQALEKENIYDDKEHYVTISKALYDKLNIDYEQALSQEPCDDTISREAVIMECIKYADHEYNVQLKKEVSETRKHDAQVIIYACDYFKTFVEKLPSVTPKAETITEVADRCRECGARYGKYRKEAKRWKNKWLKSQKSGKWILQSSNKEQGERDFIWWKCSECGHVIYSETEKDRQEYHAFCGRCGARMESEE